MTIKNNEFIKIDDTFLKVSHIAAIVKNGGNSYSIYFNKNWTGAPLQHTMYIVISKNITDIYNLLSHKNFKKFGGKSIIRSNYIVSILKDDNDENYYNIYFRTYDSHVEKIKVKLNKNDKIQL